MMYFFDESYHGWLPMPLSWERQTPFVSRLVAETRVIQFKMMLPSFYNVKIFAQINSLVDLIVVVVCCCCL